jgi:hypothetical protein
MKTLGDEVAEQLLASLAKKEAAQKEVRKRRAELKVVAENEVQPKEVRAGLVRSVGDVLQKLDPEMPKGTRFVNAFRIDAERLYWSEVERIFGQRPGVTVRFEYNPWRAYDDEVPSCHREKGR